ncbi:MAG: hypothetical protein AB7N76_29530 [Planctomycetota bacterium]
MRGPALLIVTLVLAGCPAPEDVTPPGADGGGAAPSSASDTSKTKKSEAQKKTEAKREDRKSQPAPQEDAQPPRDADVSQVKVGQRYHYRIEQPQMTVDEVWTITGITDRQVKYDLTSKTQMAPMEGVPDSPPIEYGPTPKVFLITHEDVPAPPNAPKRTGHEDVDVAGTSFPCEVYETETTKQWVSARFPRLIRMEQEGRPFKTLVRIEQP